MGAMVKLAHASLLLLLALAACRSTAKVSAEAELRGLLNENSLESRDASRVVRDSETITESIERRTKRVRELVKEGRVRSQEEQMLAALVLIDSGNADDMTMARRLALSAAESGADEAYPIAAIAIDREHYLRGEPQRFGTQYVYEPVFSRWRLHQVDPRTTDEERAAFGVPPLAEIEARTDALNEQLPKR